MYAALPLYSLLFTAAFLGIRTQTSSIYPQAKWEVGLAYALFFLWNLAIFSAAIHIPQTVWLLFLPALWIFTKRARTQPDWPETRWIFVATIIFSYWSFVTPIAENDSLAYHIPMADNAILNQSLGAYPTLNLRALFRWWGFEAQLGNLILMGKGSTAIVESAAWVSLVALFLQIRQLLNSLNLKFTTLPAIITCSAQSVFMVVTTTKNDVAFSVLAISALGYWMERGTAKSIWLRWLVPLSLYSALLLSKSHYAVVFLSIVFATQLWKPSLEKFSFCFRQAGIALTCLAVIVLAHQTRFSDAMLYSIVPVEPPIKAVSILTGLAPFEAGQKKGESPEIKHWGDVFFSERSYKNLTRGGAAYTDPNHILLLFIFPALLLFGVPTLRPTLITLLGVGILTLLFIRHPAYHSVRYLQPAYVPLCALGISLVLSIKLHPMLRWLPLALVLSAAGLNAFGFLKSRALLTGVDTYKALGRPGTPAEVVTTFINYGLRKAHPALTGKVLSIPSNIRTSSAVYLLTDSSHATITEIHFKLLESKASLYGLLAKTKPNHVVISYGVGKSPQLAVNPSAPEKEHIQSFQDPITLWFAALGWEETIIIPDTVFLYSSPN